MKSKRIENLPSMSRQVYSRAEVFCICIAFIIYIQYKRILYIPQCSYSSLCVYFHTAGSFFSAFRWRSWDTRSQLSRWMCICHTEIATRHDKAQLSAEYLALVIAAAWYMRIYLPGT